MGQKHSTAAGKRDFYDLYKKPAVQNKEKNAEIRITKTAGHLDYKNGKRDSSLSPPPSYSNIDPLRPCYFCQRPLTPSDPSSLIPNPPCHVFPTQAVRPCEPHEVLRRYMIEIMAQIFCADFDKLNTAMLEVEVTENTTSILTQQESDDLLRYSTLINHASRWDKPDLNGDEGQELRANITVPASDGRFPLWSEDMGMLLSMYEYVGTGVCTRRHFEISRRVAEVGPDEYKFQLFSQSLSARTRIRAQKHSLDSYRTILTKLKLNAGAESVILQGMSDLQTAMKRANLDPLHYYHLSPFYGTFVISDVAGFILNRSNGVSIRYKNLMYQDD